MSVELRVLGCMMLACIVWALYDDPRCAIWVKAQCRDKVTPAMKRGALRMWWVVCATIEVAADLWRENVGARFARRRMVSAFNSRRYKPVRIGKPDEHSKGIMVMRRDVSTGWWT